MGSIESAGSAATGEILALSAVMEIGDGLILLAAPSMAIGLVFDFSADAGVVIGRVAGAALLSLGAACWWARHDAVSAASRALVRGLLTYNVAIVALVVSASLGSPGAILWAIAALHGSMAIWCVWSLRIAPSRPLSARE
jgi:hypothetical protein